MGLIVLSLGRIDIAQANCFVCFFIFNQAAGLAPSMEQIEMLSEQLPKASLLKLYVSHLHRVRKNLDLVYEKFKRGDGND